MELFTLLFKTDNRRIYSGNNMVILGKVQNEDIKIFSLKVNNTVRIDTYFRLLIENDFLKSDFKTVDIQKLKNFIQKNKTLLQSYRFTGNCIDLKNFVENL